MGLCQLEQRVAIRRRPRRQFRTDVRASAWSVVDHYLLAPRLPQLLSDGAGDKVCAAARRVGNDEANRTLRIGLSAR